VLGLGGPALSPVDDDDGVLSVHPQATYRHWGVRLFMDLRIALCSPLCALCIFVDV
jgi:hypothetical protein